eukprot:CAMPEP_0114108406 /NCGR_PEP_ID=MMETSP0043_2-20121206/207_1 /TAXON_ID=464988 /ORGANISM="Hemiselmis andersenii, Strain CCMP644" /LENGTH=183 /DNA_ID=CAMNT_0001200177 /DNA_START=60 /DNA_END=612 /DNA_ORIENTATION=-
MHPSCPQLGGGRTEAGPMPRGGGGRVGAGGGAGGVDLMLKPMLHQHRVVPSLDVSSIVIMMLGDVLSRALALKTSSSNSVLSSLATMSAVRVCSRDADSSDRPADMLLITWSRAISPKHIPSVRLSKHSPEISAAHDPLHTKYMVPPGSPIRVTYCPLATVLGLTARANICTHEMSTFLVLNR